MSPRDVRGVPVEPSPAVRGCLSALVVYAIAGACLVAVWAAWPSGTGSPPPEPVPVTLEAPPATRPPVTFPAEIDDVLERAWNEGRYGCAIRQPAVDGLAEALRRDLEGTPALDARYLASSWLRERCAR